jgi:protein-ribulosamine 3-kinase
MNPRLPDPLRASVESALRHIGVGTEIVAYEPVTGGCIHHGARVQTDEGRAGFLKWSPGDRPGMFEAEADGLRALRDACDLIVPGPWAWSDGDEGGFAWLLMDYVAPSPAAPSSERRLGEGLARLHAGADESGFGWARDNWIGSLPQANPEHESWGTFWREARLAPQLTRARSQGRLTDERFDRLLEQTPDALAHVTRAELLHGDLWSGNAFFTGPEGAPVLIDPAVYRGDGEVDLAMSELFGGFGGDFYRAYDAVRPVSPEYEAFGRDLYQLYYLLVHVNLFGASYEAGATRAAVSVLEALA